MTTLTRADWEQRAQQLKIEGRAFINGEYTDAASGETFECLSPVDGRFLAKVASCDLADANRAVENARATFNSGVWSQLAPAKRKAKLIRFADLLRKNVEELALLETLDMGKPIGDSSSIDIQVRPKPSTGLPKPSTRSTTKLPRPRMTSLAWLPASR